ncbi:MAG: AAA family ATPase [Myxococcota bacterium]
MVARRLHVAFEGATYFERLLTRFTVPEELFGPLSIKGLEEDRYERLTKAYLPTASIAFLDEIFKANSAILNALLTLLNEREFDNGVQREVTLPIAVRREQRAAGRRGAFHALFDRFLLRLHVGPVSKEGFPTLLDPWRSFTVDPRAAAHRGPSAGGVTGGSGPS